MPAITNRYTVQPRDTLTAIALAHGTTVAELARLNGIANPNAISIGQVIKLFPDTFERNGVMGTAGRPSPEAAEARILAAAEKLSRERGASYATDAHASSPNPDFPAVGTPAGKWKCNMFAGDVLYVAGFEAPRYESGWYALSQEWHTKSSHFEKLRLVEAGPGDVLIIDRGAPRENDHESGGHAIILTSAIGADGSYSCIAVKNEGAVASTRNTNTDVNGRDGNGNPYQLFALRPIKRRGSGQIPDVPVVDPSAVRAPAKTPLQEGVNDVDNVKMLQRALVKLGIMTEAEMQTGPGTFGRKTKARVSEFQVRAGVAVEPGAEGIYGPKTRAALEAALARGSVD